MRKKSKVANWILLPLIILLVILAGAIVLPFRVGPSAPVISTPLPELSFSSDDRILIMAPHPDDEVIGCGGVIQKAVAMNIPVRIVFLTNGDFNEWSFLVYRKDLVITHQGVQGMGMVRHDEAVAADTSLGIAETSLTFLGYPDAGTLEIMESHWDSSPPYRALLTGAEAVPYANAFRPGAAYKGEEILADIESVIRDFRPTRIFVSHPADHHPDHQSLYLYTRVALWDLNLTPAPELEPYLVHFNRWPTPHGYFPEQSIMPPQSVMQDTSWSFFAMSTDETARKHSAIMLHRSQYEANPDYLLSFIRRNELFGSLPDVPLNAILSATGIADTGAGASPQMPEYLSIGERLLFLGFEERTARITGSDLELTASFTGTISGDAQVSLYIFGYRPDLSFARMPKIHIRFDAIGHAVYNGSNPLPADSITVDRQDKIITVGIPLQLLGNPDRLFTGARSYLGYVPLDWQSWRELEIVPAG